MADESWRALYPFESHWRQIRGGRYHYLDERQSGEQGMRAPLLMVHGNPTWSFYWRRLAQAYSPTHRVVVPDHMGCGLSDKPTDYDYCLQTHIDNLVSLIDELDLQNITLLGHDWGGAIGMGAAVARPDRFSRFVLFNTAAFPPPFFPWRIRVCRTPIVGRIALQGFNLFSRAALQMAVERAESLPPAVRAGLLAPYDCWSHRVAVWRFVKDIPASPSHPTYATLQTIESGLQQFSNRRTMLVWGKRDWCFRPSCMDRFLQHWPNSDQVCFENAGHWVIEEEHEGIVQELTKFLAEEESDK
ncbi:MAG: alpha/beta fold hydrolase [Planctomycetales bacterium]|nr:alpha/beta fold hydrolase [Planctomycetales bacterium]MCA9166478.1 alpha/beta fold hydrolase [Planctomycetales bacterium]